MFIFPQDYAAHMTFDISGFIAVPGYIDIQTNGAFGVDYSTIVQKDTEGEYVQVGKEVPKSDYYGNPMPMPSKVDLKLLTEHKSRKYTRKNRRNASSISQDSLSDYSSIALSSNSSNISNTSSTSDILNLSNTSRNNSNTTFLSEEKSDISDISSNYDTILHSPSSSTVVDLDRAMQDKKSADVCFNQSSFDNSLDWALNYISNIDKDLSIVGKLQPRFGVTSYCPTIISSSTATYNKVVSRFNDFMKAVEIFNKSPVLRRPTQIICFKLEGPFISVPGAHEVAVLRAPGGEMESDLIQYIQNNPQDKTEIEKSVAVKNVLHRYGGENTMNITSIITLAPELDGSLEAIEYLSDRGIICSLGHSKAGIAVATEAVNKGAKLITHLFNAMKAFHHRDPGIVGLLGAPNSLGTDPYAVVKKDTTNTTDLSNKSNIHYSIIADGIHVHPFALKIAYDSHQDGAILVTDSMSAMGLGPGQYNLGMMDVELKSSDGRRAADKAVVAGTDTLAGAVVTLEECVQNFKKYTGCSTVVAVSAATEKPAKVLGIYPKKGSLRIGSDADIVLLDPTTLEVRATIINGQFAYVDSPIFPPTQK